MKRFAILASVAALAAVSANCANSKNPASPSSSSALSAEARGGNGGGGKGKPGGTTGGGSLALVMWVDNNGNGLPNYADTVTFNVSTTATTTPTVDLRCFQNGVGVYGAQGAFYDSDPWPWTKYMTLSSAAWTGGAADCTATLHSLDSATALATLSFSVAP